MTEARWLDDEEQRTWRGFLWSFQQLQEALERQLQRDSSMPHAYYLILAMLSEAPDRSMTMSELAEITRFSPSRLSHAVARIEETGWVRRVRHPTDRRTTIAELTDEGLAVLRRAAPGHVEEVRRQLFDRLSPEQLRHLKEIVDTLTADVDCPKSSARR
jgi:DNA-binding MarR family transcriptional regulator